MMFTKFEELPAKLQKIPEPQPVRRAGGFGWRFQKRVKLEGVPATRISITVSTTKNKILAEEYYKQELLNRVNMMQATKKKEQPKAVLLSLVVAEYLEELSEQAKRDTLSFSTYRHYRGTLTALLNFLGDIPPKEITPTHLDNFLTDLALNTETGKPMKKVTYGKHFQRLGAFLEYCTHSRFLFPENPLNQVHRYGGDRIQIKNQKKGRKTHEEREQKQGNQDEFYTLDQINILRSLAFKGIAHRLLTGVDVDERLKTKIKDALHVSEITDAELKLLEGKATPHTLALSVFQFETGTRHSEAAAVDLISVTLSSMSFSNNTEKALYIVLSNWNKVQAEVLNILTKEHQPDQVATSPLFKSGKASHFKECTLFNRFAYKEKPKLPKFLETYHPKTFSKWKELPKTRGELLNQVEEELKKLAPEETSSVELGEIIIDKTIREGEGSRLTVGTGTKTQSTAYPLPLPSRAAGLILGALLLKFLAYEHFKNYNTHYFTGYSGRNPLTGSHYKKELKTILTELNSAGYPLPVLPSHAFRKSFTMHYLLKSPDNLTYVSRYLRHSSLQTTLNHYTSINHGKLNPEISKMFTSSED